MLASSLEDLGLAQGGCCLGLRGAADSEGDLTGDSSSSESGGLFNQEPWVVSFLGTGGLPPRLPAEPPVPCEPIEPPSAFSFSESDPEGAGLLHRRPEGGFPWDDTEPASAAGLLHLLPEGGFPDLLSSEPPDPWLPNVDEDNQVGGASLPTLRCEEVEATDAWLPG